jgi:hypothetical protein
MSMLAYVEIDEYEAGGGIITRRNQSTLRKPAPGKILFATNPN